jgi:ectoine hydroxylase-related dioxygenase (phytanoyl-CoA dioxygenase family)
MFEELRQQALKIESIAARRRFAAPGSRQGGAPGTGSNLLGSYPLFDREGVFARFATQFELLEIVNAYFGMFAQLRDYAVFKTSALLDGVNSRWHRDAPYNAPVVRLFVYFAAVATENGALLYAPGTHSKSRRGSREVIGDEVLERIAVPCVGPAGTIVFADTRGYHRASNFVSGERWSYNCGFTSPGFGADFLTRRGVERPRSLDPKSWALASPLRLRDNFFYRAD